MLVDIGTFTFVHRTLLVQVDDELLVQLQVLAHKTILSVAPCVMRNPNEMLPHPNLGDPSIALLDFSYIFEAELISTVAPVRVLHYGCREWIEPR